MKKKMVAFLNKNELLIGELKNIEEDWKLIKLNAKKVPCLTILYLGNNKSIADCLVFLVYLCRVIVKINWKYIVAVINQ